MMTQNTNSDTPPDGQSGDALFISDLHMFSRRSETHRYEDELRRRIQSARLFVFGGDIFDFSWSTHRSVERTTAAAIDWLRETIVAAPHCQFRFVLGNHDCHPHFVGELDRLSFEVPNLAWDRWYWRTGSSVFLHGDAVDTPQCCSQKLSVSRARWANDERTRGRFAHWLYDVAVAARIHHIAKLINTPKKVAKRLLHYLELLGHGHSDGIRDVYFGHTHCAMSDYEFRGVRFHNGGAPIRGLEFRVIEARVES